MWNWWQRIRDWIRRVLGGLPLSAVREAQRELEQEQAALRSAQDNLERIMAKLKAVKAQPNPNPQELGQLEGDAAAFGRQIDRANRRIRQLQQRLDALDPDGTLRVQ